MVKRQLNDEEKTFTEKNMNKYKNVIKVLEKSKEITEFKINTILPFEYEQEMESNKLLLKKISNKIMDTTGLIKICEDQIKNGIEEVENGDN